MKPPKLESFSPHGTCLALCNYYYFRFTYAIYLFFYKKFLKININLLLEFIRAKFACD